jgi:hypothetical protein
MFPISHSLILLLCGPEVPRFQNFFSQRKIEVIFARGRERLTGDKSAPLPQIPQEKKAVNPNDGEKGKKQGNVPELPPFRDIPPGDQVFRLFVITI